MENNIASCEYAENCSCPLYLAALIVNGGEKVELLAPTNPIYSCHLAEKVGSENNACPILNKGEASLEALMRD